jgi:hypothetical protein
VIDFCIAAGATRQSGLQGFTSALQRGNSLDTSQNHEGDWQDALVSHLNTRRGHDLVAEYDSFGESVFDLTLKKLKKPDGWWSHGTQTQTDCCPEASAARAKQTVHDDLYQR